MLEIKFNKFPVLETDRLLFRKFTVDDAADLFALRNSKKASKYIDRPLMKNVTEAVDLINKILTSFENNDGIAWVIELKKIKKNIGNISFWRIVKEHHRAEIGYALLPEYWGKGIMSEAIKKIIHFGFAKIKFHSIEANVNPLNLASIKLLERTGFVREAYFKENYFFDGKFLDSAIYSLVNKIKNEHRISEKLL